MDGKTDNNSVAANNLRAVESRAGSNVPAQAEDSLVGARENESEAGGLYTGSGREQNIQGSGKAKGFFKRKGPIALIIGLIFGVGGISFMGVSTELIAWKENIYSMFGQNSAIISRRSNTIMRGLLSTNRSTTTDTIFGNTKFKIGSKLSKKLSSHGIDYAEVEDANGKKLRLLVYEDTDGRRIPIVASDSDVPRANSLIGQEIEINGVKVKITDQSLTLTNARRVNKNFDVDYDAATLTFTGKIAGWFDSAVDSMYDRIVGRNARNQMDIDDPDEEKVNKVLLGNESEGVDNSNVKGYKQELDEDGKPTGRYIDDDGNVFKDVSGENGKIPTTEGDKPPDVASVEASLTARAKKAAMMASSTGCAFLKGIGAISAAIGAVQTINVIQYASKYLELADKIKRGDADETVHIALNNLNTPIKTTLYDSNGKEVVVEGSVTSGNGWNAPFSSTNIIDENDPSALFVNREYANKNALRVAIDDSSLLKSIPGLVDVVGAVSSFGASITAFRACNAIQGVAGAVSFVADLVSLFTFGISKVVKDTIKGAVDGAALAGAMIAITTVVTLVTPTIAHWFAGKLTTAFLGKTGGFSLLSGAQNIMNSNLQMSTGRYANKSNALEVFALTKDVEKEWAFYERATKSPFDVTSKYTFLGAMYNSILPIINISNSSAISAISSVADLTKKSALSLISPSVMAASETNDFAISLASDSNCSYLSAVGVVGDFACNKYSGAYVNEISSASPENIYLNMEKYDSFDGQDSDGNPIINAKSDYAKYIVACVSSDTQPGTMNGAVQGFLTGIEKDLYGESTVATGLVNFGRNFIPFEGALDAWEAGEEEANIKWNSGLACTGNTDDAAFNEKIKNFSMYNLDQRVLYNMGIIKTNSTISFLEDYYKENPLDRSFEGQIARISGMSKEEVEDTLALMEYYDFLNNYDVSTRYAFGAPAVEESHELLFDNENQLASNVYIILLNDIEFADVRNRNFVV